MFEAKIESLIKEVDENATGEDLVRCLAAHGDEGSFAVELMLGITDFANFVELMNNYKRELKNDE